MVDQNHRDEQMWQDGQGVKGSLMTGLEDDESKPIFQLKPSFSAFLTLTMNFQVGEHLWQSERGYNVLLVI